MSTSQNAGWPDVDAPRKAYSQPMPEQGGRASTDRHAAPPSRNSLSLQPTGNLCAPAAASRPARQFPSRSRCATDSRARAAARSLRRTFRTPHMHDFPLRALLARRLVDVRRSTPRAVCVVSVTPQASCRSVRGLSARMRSEEASSCSSSFL